MAAWRMSVGKTILQPTESYLKRASISRQIIVIKYQPTSVIIDSLAPPWQWEDNISSYLAGARKYFLHQVLVRVCQYELRKEANCGRCLWRLCDTPRP